MQQQNNKHNEPAAGKAAPQHVAANNEEQTKQKTEPLNANDKGSIDQEEGNMDNGEVGGSLGKVD